MLLTGQYPVERNSNNKAATEGMDLCSMDVKMPDIIY
jgi:hypothetical protein